MDRENVTFEEYYLSCDLRMPIQKCRGVHVCTCVCACACVWACVWMSVSCEEHCVVEIVEFMSTSTSV